MLERIFINVIQRRALMFYLGASLSTPLCAQSTLEEVIVTAQKREQRLQDVPVSISALLPSSVNDYLGSGENIRALAQRVPSLQIESSNGRQLPRFYIRGLGNTDFDVNANQPVSMIYDDIVLENGVLKSIPLYDVERIEVLRGPQGTLFGRNTPAGIVKIDSVKPTYERDGYLQTSYGKRDNRTVEGALATGLTDKMAARVAFKYQGRGDWIENRGPGGDVGGFDEIAYRLQFLFEPVEDFSALIKFHGYHIGGDTPATFYANALALGSAGVRPGFDANLITQDSLTDGHIDHVGFAAKLEYAFNGFLFTSISGYDAIDSLGRGDVDGGIVGGPGNIGELGFNAFFGVSTGDGLSDHAQINQEFRLSRTHGQWFYQLGLFYFKEDITVDNINYNTATDALSDLTFTIQDTTSFALFAQVEYALTDYLTLTGGIRWTSDEKALEIVPGVGSQAMSASIEKDDSYIDGDIAVTFDVNEAWAVYARFGSASRGPVTIGRFGFTSTAETEQLFSYEGGFKADLFAGRLRWQGAGYYYEIRDQQLTATGGVTNINTLLNAERTIGAGFESEMQMLVSENFRINTNLSYNFTEIKDSALRDDLCGSTPTCTGLDPVVGSRVGGFGPVTEVSIDGNPLPRAPRWIFNIDAWYGVDMSLGALYVSTDWNYRSDANIFFHESVEFVADARWIGGLRAGYKTRDKKWDIAVVGRNITNAIAVDGAINFLNLAAFINEPSYWGVEARYDFH